MPSRPRKSSACVTLVLIGAAAITGCGDGSDGARRRQYATKEECVADWGQPDECNEVVEDRAGTRHHYYAYTGTPGWRSSRGSSSGSSSASRSVTRGGFGASGTAHSAAS